MKTALITGANRGLGLGFSRHYLRVGFRVYATARKPNRCTEFDQLQDKFGDRFLPVKLDLCSEDSIAALAATLTGTELDLVLNNAGTCPDEPFGQWTASSFHTAFETNTIGPALVAQATIPLMKVGATMVNISSGLGSCGLNINPETGLDAYAASKAALNIITRRLGHKAETKGITVAAFDPGWVKTRMGGDEAELTVDESIRAITTTIEQLAEGGSGQFFSRNGEQLPW